MDAGMPKAGNGYHVALEQLTIPAASINSPTAASRDQLREIRVALWRVRVLTRVGVAERQRSMEMRGFDPRMPVLHPGSPGGALYSVDQRFHRERIRDECRRAR